MAINMEKETLNINKIVCEKKEVIKIEGDIIVPDAKPDILNAITTMGNICIYKKELMDGKVRIDGNVLIYIMYLADAEKNNVRGLNTNLDFSENINVPELKEGMDINIDAKVKQIECKILNGRKISITGILEMRIKVYSKDEINIITKIENDNVQVLKRKVKVNSLLGEGNVKTSVKENISISFDPKDTNFFFHYLYVDNQIDGLFQVVGAYSSDDYYKGSGTIEYGDDKSTNIQYNLICFSMSVIFIKSNNRTSSFSSKH